MSNFIDANLFIKTYKQINVKKYRLSASPYNFVFFHLIIFESGVPPILFKCAGKTLNASSALICV